jgi:hypothetical protein
VPRKDCGYEEDNGLILQGKKEGTGAGFKKLSAMPVILHRTVKCRGFCRFGSGLPRLLPEDADFRIRGQETPF